MASVQTVFTSHATSDLPSPTLTNPDMILPTPHDAPDSPATPTQRQRPPSLSGIQSRAQSEDKASECKKLPNVASNASHMERIRTKGRRSFGELDGTRPETRRNKLGKLRLNGGSRSSSSSPVDSNIGTPLGEDSTPRSHYDGPSWRTIDYTYGANDGGERHGADDLNASMNDESDYGFPQSGPKHMDGVITTVERGDPHSHAQNSIRAEQILQNAKRRLTVRQCESPSVDSANNRRKWKAT